ncbi:hypothetical protein DRJ17_00875 [Candidatus Woesearchaeota archaeon]|nr:MAG: hypothetical protein DRJ17_00875 [Candidatus Woesearchaeota archaeon]
MPLFRDMLHADESLLKNEQVLDFDYQPKLVKYRESQQFAIADCMKPLFNKRDGDNVLVYGTSGIGKTLACKHILQELEQETDAIIPIYVNCWEHNTTYKIALNICEQLQYPFTPNKKGVELFQKIAERLNKKSAVFVFDEIDKAEDFDFLYFISEKIFRNSIVLITNFKSKLFSMDKRLRSRLFLEFVEFNKYTFEETRGILQERVDYAFFKDVWTKEAFDLAVQKTFEMGDIRCGLLILRKAGKLAENESSRSIEVNHVEKILDKVDKYAVKGSSDLDGETRNILHLIRDNSGSTIFDVFKMYQKKKGKLVYRSFYRKVKHLELNKYVRIKKIYGGKKGNTSIVEYLGL